MSVENQFLYKLIKCSYEDFSKLRINSDCFQGIDREVYDYIIDYYTRNTIFPTETIIFEEFGISLEDVNKDIFYLEQEVFNKVSYNRIKGLVNSVNKSMEVGDVRAAINTISQRFEDLDVERKSSALNMFDLSKDVMLRYERAKAGLKGLQTPWESINDMVGGWEKGDFILFGSRSGVGKTQNLLIQALPLWRAGKKILFVSPEMSSHDLYMRLVCLHLKLSYKGFANGSLSKVQLDKLNDFLEKEKNPLYICADTFDFDIDELKTYVAQLRPDIIFVDGVYLLKVKGETDRLKKAPIIADTLKKMAKGFAVPIVCSTQLNKYAIGLKIEEMNETHFVLSDAFSWNVDAAFIMGRTKQEKEENIMKFKTVKLRKGHLSHEYITVNWNFYTNDFTEVINNGNDFVSF